MDRSVGHTRDFLKMIKREKKLSKEAGNWKGKENQECTESEKGEDKR